MNALLAILNVFIDPAETVRRIKGVPFAWFPPLLLGGIVMGFYQFHIVPFTMEAMRNDPAFADKAAQIGQMAGTMEQFSRFMALTAPIMFSMMVLIGAALVFAACVVLSINVRFPDLFSFMAHVSIINCLAMVAHFFVLKGKGEVTSMRELSPSFGLEMLLSNDAPKLLYGFLSYFSLFNIWHIVMLVIGFAALAQVSKGKALGATSPHWIAGLLLTLVGSLFR